MIDDRIGYLTTEQFASNINSAVASNLSGTFQPLNATLTNLSGRVIGAASATDILDRAAGDGRYLSSGTSLVASFNGRTGAVTLALSDVTGTGLAKGDIGLGNVENKSSATIRGELTGSNVTTALGFTPYNATNPSGYISGNQTITLSGDVSGSGATAISATIQSNVVTFSKLVAATQASCIVGRRSGSTGNFEEITLGSGLSMSSAGVLSASGSGGTVSSFSFTNGGGLTGTVINSTTTPALSIAIDVNGVALSKLTAATAASILGATAAGNAAYLTPSQAKTVLAIAASDVSGLAATATSTDAANLTGTIAAARMPALTGDITTTAGTVATSIGANKVTLSHMAQVATGTFLGRTSSLTGNVEAMTVTQATALLNAATGANGTSAGVKGLVPAPAATDNTKFLRGDMTYQTITSGSGTVTSVSVVTANGVSGTVATSTTTPAITLTLGAITPSSVASTGAISGTTGTFSGQVNSTGFKDSGSLIARFEGTGGSRPSGSTGTGLEFYNFSGEGYIQTYTVGTGYVTTRMTGGAYKFDSIATTASAANAFLDPAANNSLLRSTSSEDYKTAILPIDRANAKSLIMGLQPIQFKSRPDRCPNDDPDLVRYGFGANATAAVNPAFAHFGYHDTDFDTIPETAQKPRRKVLKAAAKPTPTGIQEPAILAALTALVQSLVKDNEALAARVAALETKVNGG